MASSVLVGLQHGDEGKGKVAHWMLKNGDYTLCIRFNGGPNAGHKVYLTPETPIVLHQVPTGILIPNIQCIIGPECVVDPIKLSNEIQYLSNAGIPNVKERLYISTQTHVITPENIAEDIQSNKVGTTASGIGPTYAKKAYRTGVCYKNYDSPNKIQQCDMYEILRQNQGEILWEGAQGFELDTDWGDYPYVTSSHCITGGAVNSGAQVREIQRIVGAAKVYDTYLGTKQLQTDGDQVLTLIQEAGKEWGNTTGRKRQVQYLNLDKLEKASWINGCTELVMSKCDILEQVNIFRLIHHQQLHEFSTLNEFKQYIETVFHGLKIYWSGSPIL